MYNNNNNRDNRRKYEDNHRSKEQVNEVRHSRNTLSNARKAYEAGVLKTQCGCTHRTMSGQEALMHPKRQGRPLVSEYTGNPLFVCTECQKQIDIGKYTEEDVRQAVAVIDRVCDFAKMRMDIRTDNDFTLYNQVKDFQYKMHFMIDDMVKVTMRNKKKKNNDNQNSGFEFVRHGRN